MGGTLSDGFPGVDAADALGTAAVALGASSAMGSTAFAAAGRTAGPGRAPEFWRARGGSLDLAPTCFLDAVFFFGFIRPTRHETSANLMGAAYVQAKQTRNVKLAVRRFRWLFRGIRTGTQPQRIVDLIQIKDESSSRRD